MKRKRAVGVIQTLNLSEKKKFVETLMPRRSPAVASQAASDESDSSQKCRPMTHTMQDEGEHVPLHSALRCMGCKDACYGE